MLIEITRFWSRALVVSREILVVCDGKSWSFVEWSFARERGLIASKQRFGLGFGVGARVFSFLPWLALQTTERRRRRRRWIVTRWSRICPWDTTFIWCSKVEDVMIEQRTAVCIRLFLTTVRPLILSRYRPCIWTPAARISRLWVWGSYDRKACCNWWHREEEEETRPCTALVRMAMRIDVLLVVLKQGFRLARLHRSGICKGWSEGDLLFSLDIAKFHFELLLLLPMRPLVMPNAPFCIKAARARAHSYCRSLHPMVHFSLLYQLSILRNPFLELHPIRLWIQDQAGAWMKKPSTTIMTVEEPEDQVCMSGVTSL